MANSYLSCGADPSELQKQLNAILENNDIRTVFQPIISLRDGAVLGYEALSRGPSGSVLQNPDALFGVATECGKLWELDRLCRSTALETACRLASGIRLFLNVHPQVIYDEKFKSGFTAEFLRKFDIDPENIYIEITEKNAAENPDDFRETIAHYKNQNYKIAIDDAGAGYSGLNMITDIRPHFIKLDIYLIRGIDKDEYKKSLVKSLYEFCKVSSISLIAEGIETEEELGTLIDIGVHYGQGYFVQKPNAVITAINDSVLDSIRSRNAQKNHIFQHYFPNVYIGNLCRKNPFVSAGDTVESVYNMFLKDDALLGVVVAEAGTVSGIVTKTCIDHFMSGQYGYSLYAKRTITKIMDRHPLVSDFRILIDTVAKMAMSRPAASLYDFIVITQEGKYCGIVTIKDLLEKTMEIEISNARHQNPLSGLPGNLLIEQNLIKCISSTEPFTVLYTDLDNFKSYNDVYGFENGDSVIRYIADLLCGAAPEGSFVGHVGGDDFICIVSSHETQALCESLIRKFDDNIKNYYSAEDMEKGFILAKNRKGEEDQFPIMTVSIAGVTNLSRSYKDIYELTECAGAVKKRCKLLWKSCFYVD